MGKPKAFSKIFSSLPDELRRRHKESHRRHEEHNKVHREFQRQQDELMKRIRELHRQREELDRYHRRMRFAPHLILIVNLIVWYLIFRYAGFKTFSVFIALLISVGGLFQIFFLRRIGRRIIEPLDGLASGMEEIAKGNYDVRVESDAAKETGALIASFNDMALKLRESEKLKAEYEENRKNLIANISHDLKTPITSIQGYIEAILDGSAVSPENTGKYLKIIYNNTAYMNKLVDDLFLFSKLDMQKLEFQFEKVPARPFITDLMEEFKLEFDERKIDFSFRNSMEKDLMVNIDRKRMHQVFKNVIGNAVKYGKEDELSIRTELYLKDGYVCMDVADNGPGIPEDKLPYIFDRFYRIDTERTKDFMSTGLGLAISKELVEAHGGNITASSRMGEGTCFTIALPAAQ